MKKRARIGLVFVIAALGIAIFGRILIPSSAIARGPKDLEVIRELTETFPGGDHQIAHFCTWWAGGPSVWHSHVYLHGRYELSVHVDIRIGWRLSERGPATVTLSEVAEISKLKAGNTRIEYKEGWVISDERWQILIDNDGDFSSIGITLDKDNPVDGFAEYYGSG